MISHREIEDKWYELHNEIVQKIIDFCKDNNITEATDFGLKIDGLDESIEYGKWTPGSDSCMSLTKMEFIDGKRNYYRILESL